MQVIQYPSESGISDIIRRPVLGYEEIEGRVSPVLEEVRIRGGLCFTEVCPGV
ncbi:MAG: hypothetical protein LRY55_01680 [Leadbetterella sp.]|nr:hypothetical protein [Leadbetterella sp.]